MNFPAPWFRLLQLIMQEESRCFKNGIQNRAVWDLNFNIFIPINKDAIKNIDLNATVKSAVIEALK